MVASRGWALLLLVFAVLAASVVAQQCPDYTWRTVRFFWAILGRIGGCMVILQL